MRCPYCHSLDTVVKDTRPVDNGEVIKRRRECESCHMRFNSFEKYESLPLMVLKKDKTRQPYERAKIERGLLQACHKRPVSTADMERMMNNIERKIFNSELKGREIKSREIGEIVLEELRAADDVAFIRFASIYKDFNDVETFRRELDRLSKKETESEC